MADVFISYHVERRTSKIVREIAERLEKQEIASGPKRRTITCWYCERNMRSGEDFSDVIPQQIDECCVFLLVLDRGALESGDVSLELKQAGRRFIKTDGANIKLLQYRLEEVHLTKAFRYYLTNLQRIDGTPHTTESMEKLVKAAVDAMEAMEQNKKERSALLQLQEMLKKFQEENQSLKETIVKLQDENQRLKEDYTTFVPADEKRVVIGMGIDVDRLLPEGQNKREGIRQNYCSSKKAYDTARPEGWMESPGIRTIGGIVGEGHHSTVYSVTLENGEMAVLKVDHRDLAKQFLEVREKVFALRGIHHPNISELIGFVPGINEDCSYILMEYVPGETLEKLYYDRMVAEKGDLFPWWEVIRWGDQILNALEYLHSKGLVHGDIRLSNIMFCPKKRDADKEYEICLLDFNWAAPDRKDAAQSADRESSEAKSNTFRTIGDDKQLQRGIQRDIYYTGMVMFQLLTGELLDQNESRKALGNRQKRYSNKYKRETLIRHGVDSGLADVIVKSLAPQLEDRYVSAGEMRSALKSFLDKAPQDNWDNSGRVFRDYEAAKEVNESVNGLPADETIKIQVGQIGGIIGEGRHSTVFFGELSGSGKRIALKKDHRNLMEDFPEIWKKVQALEKIRDEHISRLLEFIPDYKNNCSYIVMDYIPGATLRETLTYRLMEHRGAFSQDRTLTIALQILDALETLHNSGVVHGDINLSNIILRPERKDEEDDICLIDFNLSAPDGINGMTTHQMDALDAPSGTMVPVRDPEAFRRGVLRDIYHVGAVMYQLLTGEVPDSGADKQQTVEREKAESAETKWKKLKDNGVSAAIAQVILKAVSYNPNNRYASAKEMRKALLELPGQAENWFRQRNRRRFLAGAAAAILLLLAGFAMTVMGFFQLASSNSGAETIYFAQDGISDSENPALPSALSVSLFR